MPADFGAGFTRSHWAGVAAVAGVAILAALTGLHNAFVQDDTVLIADHIGRLNPGRWQELLISPYWPAPYNRDLYRPLTSLFLAIEWAVGGGAPLLYRLVSYLLYAATSVGVLLVARRILPWSIALGMSLIFAAHPVHVEAVALGVGQSELLVGLLAAAMAIRYLDARRRGDGSLSITDWAILAALYLAAGLTKEHGLVLPALLLSAEFLLLPAEGWAMRRRLLPGYGLLAAVGAGILAARSAVLSGSITGTTPAEALEGLSAGARALTLVALIPEWARLLLWPAHLQSDYSPQELIASAGFGAAEALGIALVIGAAAAAWLGRRRMPVVSFGLAWMAIALFPVSNLLIPTGVLLAERTLFLASIGMVLAAGGLVAAALPRGSPLESPRWVALQLGCVTLVGIGVVRSAERQRIWKNEAVFTARSVEDAPESYRMQKAWGFELFKGGHRAQALEAYRRAIALAPEPHVWRVRNDLARRHWEEGANELAVEQLRASLATAPGVEETRNYLVLGYLALGQYGEAAREAEAALALGFSREEFRGLRALADSAARASAPPGSIKIRINTGPPPAR